MENHASNQKKVGIFLAIGFAVTLGSIVLLGKDTGMFSRQVNLYAVLEHVQGLNIGSVVSLSGLTVGNVKNIEFSEEKKALIVNMKIQEKYLPRITKGSAVDIRTQGALGDKYLYINPGSPNDPPLKSGDYLDTAQTSDILGIIAEKGGEATKVFDIINEIHVFTKNLNANGRSERLIVNLVDASQSFKQTVEETRKLVAELRSENPAKIKESIAHLNNILQKLDRGQGTLGALINDPTLHERLKTLLGADQRKQSIQTLIRNSIEKSD